LIEITYDGSHVLIMRTCEPSYVISIKHKLSLADDGSYVIRNMLK